MFHSVEHVIELYVEKEAGSVCVFSFFMGRLVKHSKDKFSTESGLFETIRSLICYLSGPFWLQFRPC